MCLAGNGQGEPVFPVQFLRLPGPDYISSLFGNRTEKIGSEGAFMDGLLNMPAVVCNYYIPKVHLKLSAMYQYTGRYGHKTQLDRDNDDLGIATHHASVQLQFSF